MIQPQSDVELILKRQNKADKFFRMIVSVTAIAVIALQGFQLHIQADAGTVQAVASVNIKNELNTLGAFVVQTSKDHNATLSQLKATDAQLNTELLAIKQVSDATKELLHNGKSASAENAKQAEENAKAGEVIIKQVETLLDTNLAEIEADLSKSKVNHALIEKLYTLVCSIANRAHISSITIAQDC